MKQSLSILLAVLFFAPVFGQDEKANKILEEVSKKTKSYETIIIDFELKIMPAEGGEAMTQSGKAYMKGDKYMAQLEDQEIYCDGKTVTTYLKEENECYTSSVEDNKEEGVVSPTEILTIWEEDYKARYDADTEYEGVPVHQIYLYPKNPGDSNIHTIVLRINKEKNELMFVLIKTKDGTKTIYKLKKFQHDVPIDDSKFVFNKAKHPGVECYEE